MRHIKSILLSLCLCLGAGCYLPKPVSVQSPEWRAMKDTRYRLVVEAYVYEELQEKTKLRFVGFPTVAPGVGSRRFPPNPGEWLGRRYGTVRLLEAIPAGTEFRLLEHRIENHPTMGIIQHPIILLSGPWETKWGPLDAFWLADQRAEKLRWHAEVVEPIHSP